jgi:glycosyltransferase involved in cell wall biosynthesis
LATRIDGSLGLLGPDYPGYFPVGDTEALMQLLIRIETDPAFRKRLTRAIARRAPLFRPAREMAEWKSLLEEVMPKSLPPRRASRRARRVASTSAVTDLTNR